MSETDVAQRRLPAYVSFKTFWNFLESLRGHPVPARVDRSLMRHLSGSSQSALQASLRFLGLVDDEERPTRSLMTLLAAAADEKRQEELGRVVREAYDFLREPEFELERATAKQLEEHFRNSGASGTTVKKAMAFFVALVKKAAMQVSPHLRGTGSEARRALPGTVTRRTRRPRDTSVAPREETRDDQHLNRQRLEIPLPGKASAVIELPRGLDAADWKLVETVAAAFAARLLQESAEN
ncbi:MAG: DUF5343 domain-containing protein [bacterium]